MITLYVPNPIRTASELSDKFLVADLNTIVLAPTVELIALFSGAGYYNKMYWLSRTNGNAATFFRAATRMSGLKSVAAQRLVLVFDIPQEPRELAIERLRGSLNTAIYQLKPILQTPEQCKDEILSEKLAWERLASQSQRGRS